MSLPASGPGLLLLVLPIAAHFMSAGLALVLPHGPEAVAMVITTRNETRVRLLLGTPDALFTCLATPTSRSQNQDLVRWSSARHELVAIDSDYDDKVFYVMDRKTRSITAISGFSGEWRSYIVYSGISHRATALSADWVEDAVYWADPAYDAIFRFKGSGHCRHEGCVRTVVSLGLDDPRGLALSPHWRLLFWVDGGGRDGTSSKLERSDLSGDNRVVLFQGLSHPSGIALDHSSNRVYWLAQNGASSLVESCDLEGRDRYRVAVLADSQVKAMAAWRGLLVMGDILNNEVVFHSLEANVSRRLSAASPSSLTVFAPHEQTPATPSMGGEDGPKDLVGEGFLLLASEQGGVSILDKTAATSSPRAPIRHILARHSVTAMAADVSQTTLYFFDRRQGAIMWLSLEFLRPASDSAGSEPMARVLTRVPGNVGGLAVDWLGKAVYWTDTQLQRLAAVTVNGRHVRCLVCDLVTKPRDLVLHPQRGLVFWVDVEDSDPRIEKIRMDGRQRATVVSGGHVYTRPRALAIDFKDDMLYWSDGSQLCRAHVDASTVWAASCSTTGQLTQPAVKSIEVLHDFLVWTDFLGNVEVGDKDEVVSSSDESSDSSSSRRTVMALAFSTDLLYLHPSRQPAHPANRCSTSHGRRCHHFCLPAGPPHCACSIGYWTRANGSCVSGFVTDRFLLVTDPLLGGLFQRYVSLPDYYVIPLVELVHPSDVIFDGTTRMVYWADTGVGAISRAYLNGSFQEIVFAHRDIVAETLFLDHRRQLLYFIDTTGHRVGLVSLPTMTFTIILDSPNTTYHDVTGHLTSGALYLSGMRLPPVLGHTGQPPAASSHPETSGVIVRCHLTGSEMSDVLVGLDEPRGLAIRGEALYWLDASTKAVSLLNLTSLTSSVIALLPEWSAPSQLTLLDNSLYWADSTSPYLTRMSPADNGEIDELSGSALFRIQGITSYDSRVQAEETSLEFVETSVSPEVLVSFRSVDHLITDVMVQKGFCGVPAVPNGRVLNHKEGAYVTSGHVIQVECRPGYGLEGTQIRRFNSVCRHGMWDTRSACTWAMTYTISEARAGRQGHYVIFTSSSEFVVPEGITYVDALAIGGGGGGVYACSQQLANLTRAGDGGDSRVGRHLRAGGGQGGTVHEGGRGGFGTVYFGGQGRLSSTCRGGGAAGENEWPGACSLGSTTCPFCGAGGAPTSCSLCQDRPGGCRGPWAVPGQGADADLYGGGGTGWAGGGGGGGGGYSRMTIDVTPGEVIQVTVGGGGQPSAGRAAGGVVVLAWGGRLQHVLLPPDERRTACRNFTWSVQPLDIFDDDFNLVWCSGRLTREP